MRVSGRWWVSVLLAAVLGVPLALPAVAGAQSEGAFLDGSEPWTESDCAGDVPIVVGSDVAAQSDIYSAVTLAGVVGTDCVILAGPRGRAMPAEQRARLDAAAAGGYVVGGNAAVPDAKLAGRDMTRLGGATRWATAQIIGNEARYLADGTRPDSPSTSESDLSAPADVSQPGVYLGGAEPWIASDCAGDAPIVVGSDAAAQSDIYSAVTLAGVVGTDCVILAGPRDGAMPASQQARLDAAADGGFVLGGIAAVPTAKIAGRDMTRLGGATRWATAQLVGRRASGDATAGTRTAAETTEEEAEEVDLVIPPNEPYWSNYLAWKKFSGECGFWSSDIGYGPGHCEDPEDTQYVIETSDNMLGCTKDWKKGGCKGYTSPQYWLLLNILACPENWWFANSQCYHPDHPEWWYDQYEGVSLP